MRAHRGQFGAKFKLDLAFSLGISMNGILKMKTELQFLTKPNFREMEI